MPALAAALVVLVAAGGVGAYVVFGGKTGATSPAGRTAAKSPAAAGAAAGPDVCSMLPKDEADRLVPDAKVSGASRENEYTVVFSCSWANDNISYGEYRRSRLVEVKVEQHVGDGAKTGRAMAQNSFEVERQGAEYGATAKPTWLKEDEKLYQSKVRDIPGVGEGAFAQYTWQRTGKLTWLSFGEALGRVDDFTISVRFQASQQRKDAEILSTDTVQSVTEENALREVSRLIPHFAKGVAGWKARNPGVLAKPGKKESVSSPTPEPTPEATVLAAFPPACQAVTEAATRLVPSPTPRARGLEQGNDSQTECRWLNREIADGDTARIRSVLITTHRFTNRAGELDAPAAKAYFVGQRGSLKGTAGTSIGGITWGRIVEIDGLGEDAFGQYARIRRGEVFAASGTVLVLKGATVVQVDFSGHDRPKDEPTNSPKAVLLPEKQANAGALDMARAYVAELARQPAGS